MQIACHSQTMCVNENFLLNDSLHMYIKLQKYIFFRETNPKRQTYLITHAINT